MVPRTKILQRFLQDALRLNAQAREELRQLDDQATIKRVSPSQVRSFFQVVHTLKGTAALVDEAREVVLVLARVEDHLSEQGVVESSRHPEWIRNAREALEKSHELLQEIQRRERMPTSEDAEAKGFLARIRVGALSEYVWFPMNKVLRVVPPARMGGEEFGVVIRGPEGDVLVAIDEVIDFVPWSDAQSHGALAGWEQIEAGKLGQTLAAETRTA
jgi:hypothetical protein